MPCPRKMLYLTFVVLRFGWGFAVSGANAQSHSLKCFPALLACDRASLLSNTNMGSFFISGAEEESHLSPRWFPPSICWSVASWLRACEIKRISSRRGGNSVLVATRGGGEPRHSQVAALASPSWYRETTNCAALRRWTTNGTVAQKERNDGLSTGPGAL